MDVDKAPHNDSSVSSASQLLENPSPISWAFCSPSSDLDNGEFTLKRQRGIRRKRVAKNEITDGSCKKPKREKMPLIEAINRHVKRHALETDLDSSMLLDNEVKQETTTTLERKNEVRMDEDEIVISEQNSTEESHSKVK